MNAPQQGNNTPAKSAQSLHPSSGIILCLITSVVAEIVLGMLPGSTNLFSSSGRVAIVFLSIYTIHRFALVSLRRYQPSIKDFLLIHLILIGSVIIVGLGRFLAVALAAYVEQNLSLEGCSALSLYFAIPYATGALLTQAVLGLHFGLVMSLSLGFMVGIYTPEDAIFVPYVIISSLVACLSLSRFRSRSAYLKAGINIAVVMFPFALASMITGGTSEALDIFVRLIGAFMGGVLCVVIAASITPVIEYLGGYVTDMRLIEMATLDHPLLKEISIQAPGTWNHSMVIGMMVESAADAIGANPVLARVGAYFHDIGKMKKPLYFVENQIPGENRHDKLSTSMSALIIRSHVKDGIELAKKHKLPEVIIDMIPQHHGTSLIEYFYEKACKEAEEAEEIVEVDRSLYSYPGPKPQTREAGLLMLADGIEAATRTLSDPSLDRIQGLVQKMINKVFASGELNECELTLQDLHQIAKCFTRVLSGIYHQRIAYAEPAEKVAEKPAKAKEAQAKDSVEEGEETREGAKNAKAKTVGNGDSAKKSKQSSEDKGTKENTPEDLKRLGM
ncbi:MAG: HDIG domain-containing protein [Bdellovibrionales bacterium]|nr:HDIG domain-containing protein [Bdellovibrionales bacterium]